MRTNRILVGTMLVAGVAAAASVYALTRTQSPQLKPVTVLFMYPRGAAKSVLASAYFERMARERGLNVRVQSVGTDPDPTVAPAVAAHLKREG